MCVKFNQKLKKFTVRYHSDSFEELLTEKETRELHDDFEHWCDKVSKSGQMFSHKQSFHIITGAFDKEVIEQAESQDI